MIRVKFELRLIPLGKIMGRGSMPWSQTKIWMRLIWSMTEIILQNKENVNLNDMLGCDSNCSSDSSLRSTLNPRHKPQIFEIATSTPSILKVSKRDTSVASESEDHGIPLDRDIIRDSSSSILHNIDRLPHGRPHDSENASHGQQRHCSK